MEQEIKEIIVRYGSHILCSDTFRETFEQPHHYKTTVGDHTLGVTAEAVKLCLRYGQTADKTLENVVTSCLCHDLSMIGRDEKYRNNLQTLIWHPRHSAQVYQDLTGEDNERVLNAIHSHMFPLKPSVPPKHREGWILTLADKIISSKDFLNNMQLSPEEREEIMELAARAESEEKQCGSQENQGEISES